MTSIAESSAAAGTPISAVLAAGVDTVSFDQEVVFTQYVRMVLPIDGYVFLVNASLVSSNPYYLAAVAAAQATGLPTSFTAKGSLHFGTVTEQEETLTHTVNAVTFTSLGEIPTLNAANPALEYLCTYQGMRFGFSARKPFYAQSGTWHYYGNAKNPAFDTQIIDDPTLIDTTDVIVSNSLPLWLSLFSYAALPGQTANPGIQLYPSFLVPRNLPPPYGTIHIAPGRTEGVQSAPLFTSNLSQYQLCFDEILVTLYGVKNNAAMDFIALVGNYTLNTGNMGLSSIPVVQDEKYGQVEFNLIAQKKTIRFVVNYYQNRMNDVARQLIKTALVSVSTAAV